MSVRYPPPPPMRVNRNPPISLTGSSIIKSPFLPAAPAADVELPSLLMAPMQPPRGTML